MKSKTISSMVVGVTLLVSIALISGMVLSMNDEPYHEIDSKGEKVGYSIYVIYHDKVYASVPSNGFYLMKDADPASFKLLPEGTYYEHQFAIDKNHAYCGNLAIPAFNPNSVKSLGNNYFTDGNQTVYCSMGSVRNYELSTMDELFQSWLYGWDLGDKPQTYIYPMKPLPASSTPYQSLLSRYLATDGQRIFYQGEYMPDADPATLQDIGSLQDDDSVRDSLHFYRDNLNVYYDQYKLPIKSHSGLYSLILDGLFQEGYLIDPQSGNVAMNDILFPEQHAPYQLISRHSQHVNQALFLSRDGVFFYHREKEIIVRAGANPFIDGELKEIAPLVFTHNNQTYYLQDSEIWGTNKNPGLISRSTKIYRFNETNNSPWEKVGDLDHRRFGQVWKKGDEYYYFDNLGSTQLIRYTIYRVDSQRTVNRLLNEKLLPRDIRVLIDNDDLQPIRGTEVVHAITKYR
ncbi:TPA: DKNYY domain-containing protein [Providencia alcalifaciens]|uniref:DKNYY domain-containing protein n=1 Tax=Providencia alcalifaciens TaxID=126385 RepID=UPI0012B5CB69|nr:DKNYY domain-containing protein [Providencia alcalifaciens]MTC38561.1 hypothetical protein [Providencia alcalifaciens]